MTECLKVVTEVPVIHTSPDWTVREAVRPIRVESVGMDFADVLIVVDGTQFTVNGAELIRAIKNARHL